MEATAARHLEAAGATSATFEFRGSSLTIPRALEAWPLAAIRAGKCATGVKILLGGQRPAMSTRGDVIELSHRMADACGVTPLPEVPVTDDNAMFGAVPLLLELVDNHGDDLEADLRRFFGVDYRQPVDAGGPTLRQVWVYVRRIPRASALLAARNGGEPPWSREAVLNARVIEMWTRKPYPGRPITTEEVAEWKAKEAANAKEMDHLADRESYYHPGRRATAPPAPPQPNQNPVASALAVAQRNALRTPKRGSNDGRRPAANPRGPIPYDPRGSGWG